MGTWVTSSPIIIEPDIIDECADFWVVNKPVGWTVQRDAQAPSVLQWLETRFSCKAYPVHRLDKPTSGLLLVAKTSHGNRHLSMSFADKTIQKTYLAISDQKPKKKQGWVKGDMKMSRRSQWKLIRSNDNPAITQFSSYPILDGHRGFVLNPKTGKTHQLRVALKSLGSPILGDDLYGGTPADRVYLHAWQLNFRFDEKPYDYRIDCHDGFFEQWDIQSLNTNKIK